MTTTELDPGKVEEFAGRMVGLMNSSMLGLMTSVGHRTGLFDTLATLPPSTSAQVAEAAGLDERYVREWLNAMTVGRFVDYDPSAGTYALPPEHAASLTRAAGPGNMANMAQFTALMGGVEDEIVDCFRQGGGVPYSRFPKFQELMAEMSGQVHDAALIEGELALVDGLIDRLREGIDVCDVGCGQGHAINLMAKEFPNSRFTGLDFSEEGIAAAQKEAAEHGLTNVTFEVKDAATLDGSTQFDFITVFDAVHDQAQARRRPEGDRRLAQARWRVPVRRHRRFEPRGGQPRPPDGPDALLGVDLPLHDRVARARRRRPRHDVGRAEGR